MFMPRIYNTCHKSTPFLFGVSCCVQYVLSPSITPSTYHILLWPQQVFETPNFLQLSESMVNMMMARNLEVSEIIKFEAMLTWAKHRIKMKGAPKADSRVEYRCIMERLTRELKLYRISPQDLIKVHNLNFV